MVVNERASLIEASAERVWTLFSTQEGQRIASRGYVAEMDFEGDGLGMVRTMRTQGHLGDACVVETCSHYDPENMEMMYRIVDTGGLVPFADYKGFAKVIRAGEGACVLMLRSTFIPVDTDEESARAMSARNFDLFFDNVRSAVASGAV